MWWGKEPSIKKWGVMVLESRKHKQQAPHSPKLHPWVPRLHPGGILTWKAEVKARATKVLRFEGRMQGERVGEKETAGNQKIIHTNSSHLLTLNVHIYIYDNTSTKARRKEKRRGWNHSYKIVLRKKRPKFKYYILWTFIWDPVRPDPIRKTQK